MNNKIKPTAIARIAALMVALVNQCLAIFGRGALPFAENTVYQVVSLVATMLIAVINAWYNNDITKIARICGGVFDALSDGKITKKELEDIMRKEDGESKTDL